MTHESPTVRAAFERHRNAVSARAKAQTALEEAQEALVLANIEEQDARFEMWAVYEAYGLDDYGRQKVMP